MAVVTMLVGVYMFFFQDDLKRLLAYSTITHLSYILLGVAFGIMGSESGMFGGIMHIMNHGMGKGLLFLCVGAISYTTGTRSIKALGGLAKKAPIIAVAFFVGMFAILGVPPFSGFWSKFYILIGAIDLGGAAGVLLLIPFLIEIIIAFAWFLRVGHKVFFGPVTPATEGASNPPAGMSFSLIILTIMCVIAPFIALALVNQISF
jgi:hydrogenase-4 component D